jgi:hypothetical protein
LFYWSGFGLSIVFRVIACGDQDGGRADRLLRVFDSLDQALGFCSVALWAGEWSAVAAMDEFGRELVCYRRFPPGRVRSEVLDLDGGVEYEIRNGMGARLFLSSSGRKRRS